MEIKIEFFGYWHCGSGSSGGSRVDALVTKDKNGLPYIPGKTIKGHIREMALTLNNDEFVNKCFGKASIENGYNTDRQEGECYFSSARLKEEVSQELTPYLYHTIASTKIVEKGLADSGSLREIEVVVPLTLYATIDKCYDEKSMGKAFKQVKRIGLNRSRGLGRCEISLVAKEVKS